MLVAGVDGCRGGWVVAVASVDELRIESVPAIASVSVVASVADVVRDDRVAHVCIDMPIGLPSSPVARAADVAARRLLGPRRSSVFPTPCRAVLDAASWPDALERSRASVGRGLSKQAWNLVPKIAEVDSVVTPALQARVHETHPELAFTRLAGAPMTRPKRESEGRAERLAVLAGCLELPMELAAAVPRGAAGDDVLDALVLARTAVDVASGTAWRLGDGALDDRGLVMEIWG